MNFKGRKSRYKLISVFLIIVYFPLSSSVTRAQNPQMLIGSAAGVTATEIQEIESSISACVGFPLKISEDEIMLTNNTLMLMFEQHENIPTRNARYTAIFAEENWNAGWLMMNGQQSLSGKTIPVDFSGLMNASEVDEIYQLISEYWLNQAEINDIQLISLHSSSYQKIEDCSTTNPDSGSQKVYYQVIVESPMAPAQLSPPPPPRTDVIASFSRGSGSGLDGQFSFWLERENENSAINISGVFCYHSNECNSEVLSLLQASISNPTSSETERNHRQAILNAIPEEYNANSLEFDYFYTMALDSQLLMAHMQGLSISPSEYAFGHVNCQKQFEERDWQCNFTLSSRHPK